MAVNKKTYRTSITIPYANQSYVEGAMKPILDQLRQMFIDNGVMAEWHDSWNTGGSGSTSDYYRVLKVTLDANKTYGSYYILFNASLHYYDAIVRYGFSVSCGGWNATSHVPTGTQYVDYYAAPTTQYSLTYTRNFFQAGAGGGTWTSHEITLVSYKSGNTLVFFYPNRSYAFVLNLSLDAQPSWLDLNKVCVPTIFGIAGDAGAGPNLWRLTYIWYPYNLRRFVQPGKSVTGTTVGYFNYAMSTAAYMYVGNHSVGDNSSASATNDPQSTGNYFNWGGAIRLPWSDGSSNASITEPWAPIITNIDLFPPLNIKMSSDFAFMTLPSTSKTLTLSNRIKLSDTEVWEAIPIASSATPMNTMALMARIV